MIKNALLTYMRPEITNSPELLCVSLRVLQDIGLNPEEAETEKFKHVITGNNIST